MVDVDRSTVTLLGLTGVVLLSGFAHGVAARVCEGATCLASLGPVGLVVLLLAGTTVFGVTALGIVAFARSSPGVLPGWVFEESRVRTALLALLALGVLVVGGPPGVADAVPGVEGPTNDVAAFGAWTVLYFPMFVVQLSGRALAEALVGSYGLFPFPFNVLLVISMAIGASLQAFWLAVVAGTGARAVDAVR